MLGQPLLDLRRLLRGVVHDQVQVPPGIAAHNELEVGQELSRSMVRVAGSSHLSGGDIEGGEQSCGPGSFVVWVRRST